VREINVLPMHHLHLLKLFLSVAVYIFGKLIRFLKPLSVASHNVILGMNHDDLLIVSAYKENKPVMGITKKGVILSLMIFY